MMNKTSSFNQPGLCYMALLLLLASCNETVTTPAQKDSVVTTENTTAKVMDPQVKDLSDNLDTLWIDVPTFVPLNPKLTFRFYDTSNAFTLHGWLGNNTSFNNKPPDVRLQIGKPSIIKFGTGCYFGNLLMDSKSLNVIQGLIKSNNSKFVLFAPQDPALNGGQVIYAIFLTNDDPHPLASGGASGLIPTNEFTNPSPPKNE
jgi:hypothetical protein